MLLERRIAEDFRMRRRSASLCASSSLRLALWKIRCMNSYCLMSSLFGRACCSTDWRTPTMSSTQPMRYTTGTRTSAGASEPTNSRTARTRAQWRAADRPDAPRDRVLDEPLVGLAPVVAELARGIVPDPLADGERDAFRRPIRRHVALRAGHAHHIADPAQVGVLHLQEVVVRKLRDVAARNAGRRPVELHRRPSASVRQSRYSRCQAPRRAR